MGTAAISAARPVIAIAAYACPATIAIMFSSCVWSWTARKGAVMSLVVRKIASWNTVDQWVSFTQVSEISVNERRLFEETIIQGNVIIWCLFFDVLRWLKSDM